VMGVFGEGESSCPGEGQMCDDDAHDRTAI